MPTRRPARPPWPNGPAPWSTSPPASPSWQSRRLTALVDGDAALDAAIGLGLLYETKGDTATAATWYRTALATNPDNAAASLGLSRVSAGEDASPLPALPTPAAAGRGERLMTEMTAGGLPIPTADEAPAPPAVTPGEGEEKPRRRRKAFLLLFLLGLLAMLVTIALWYLIFRQPITPPIPVIPVSQVPAYATSIYGADRPVGVAVNAAGRPDLRRPVGR